MPSPPALEDRILVLEPETEGHSQEWLGHLINFAAGRETCRIEIVAPLSLCDALRPSIRPAARGRISLFPLSSVEHRFCTHRRLAVSGFARWWAMRQHLRRSGAQSGFFLSIDHLSLPLAFGLGAGGGRLSGILFRPSVHYAALGSYHPTFTERLRDWRKGLLYRMMLRNPALRSVLSLDPYFPGYANSHYSGGRKVTAVPDPVHATSGAPSGIDRFADYAPPERIGFLLFGYLARRKGPLEVLRALGRLRPQTAARVAVMLAGRIDPNIRAEIEAECQALSHKQPSLWLRVVDRRLESAEIDALIDRSGVVLAPYQRFVGSSGVLLWAARAGRPILTQEFGLIGRLTRDHGLGLATNSADPACLAVAFEHIVKNGTRGLFDPVGAERFVASRTPQQFASTVLSAARGAST